MYLEEGKIQIQNSYSLIENRPCVTICPWERSWINVYWFLMYEYKLFIPITNPDKIIELVHLENVRSSFSLFNRK